MLTKYKGLSVLYKIINSVKQYFRQFFTDWRKVERANGLIMTNIFDVAFGRYGTLFTLFMWMLWGLVSISVIIVFIRVFIKLN